MNKKIIAGALASVMAVAGAMSVSAVDVGEIKGDLTVTTFFNEKTDAVELKQGGSYTLKFHEKSNGTNAWDTFVLGVVTEDAIGGEYPGKPGEILVFRGDNWVMVGEAIEGVGKADSFIFNPAEDTVTSYVDGTWGCDGINWVGLDADVEVTVSRDKDTDYLKYELKIDEYSLSAWYDIDLPESVYLFLTGENVTLSGITVTGGNPSASTDNNNGEDEEPKTTEDNSNNSNGNTDNTTDPDKTTPNSGIEGVAVVAGLAIVAAGAVVVAKKRK